MAEYEGNVLRPPGVSTPVFNPDVEELLGSAVGYTQKGGTVEAGIGILEVGTPVKFNGTSGYWEKATASDVEGFVRHAVDATSEDMLINVVLKGTIKKSVKGLALFDWSTAATTLNGREIDAFGWFTF